VSAVPEASLTLPVEPSSIGDARQFLRRSLASWGVDEYDLGGPQVLTELATNAALHARSAYTVHLVLEPAALLVEVTDSSPALPQHRHYGVDATTGRGIALVEALSSAWGVESSPTGKTVWCRVAPDDAFGGPPRTSDVRRRPRGGRAGLLRPEPGSSKVRASVPRASIRSAA
jgi:anti-sigma regulatory factor (Ser/Thr protein kinase)